MAINVSKGISHLEHLEDFVIINGIEGGNLAVKTIENLIKKIETKDGNLITSTKIDGAPSLYFGSGPDGKFFVSTKSILNKKDPKVGRSLAEIQQNWKGGVVDVLSSAFKNFKGVFKEKGLTLQGDLLWSNRTQKKLVEHEGQKFITFQPNTIMYAVPVDNKSDLYKNVKAANVGIVIHGAYTTKEGEGGRFDLERIGDQKVREMSSKLNAFPGVFVVDPYIDDISVLKGSESELTEIKEILPTIEKLINEIDSDFNKMWVDGADSTIKKAKSLLPIFINQQVKLTGDTETIISTKNEEEFLNTYKKELKKFLKVRAGAEADKLTSISGKEKKAAEFQKITEWLDEMQDSFEPVLKIFFRLYNVKQIIVDLFDNVEHKLGQTFVVDRKNDFEMKATKEEGYVLLDGANMVKIVDRVEFSRNNFLYSPFQQHDEETIYTDEEKYGIEPQTSLVDSITEEILESLDAVSTVYDGFNDEQLVEAANKFKEYVAVFVGRFQPPTIAHVQNIVDLSKMFYNVCVMMSDVAEKTKTKKYLEKNPLTVEMRTRLFETDKKISGLSNVDFKPGQSFLSFGLYKDENEEMLRKLFDIKKDKNLVVVFGKEDDRYYDLKNRNVYFDINVGEEPTDEKKVGIYGMDLVKKKGMTDKVSATFVRQSALKGDDKAAKRIMAGNEETKEEALEMIRNNEASDIKAKQINMGESIIVENQLLEDIKKTHGYSQEEAMDFILKMLEK